MWSAGPCTHDPHFRTQANGGCIMKLTSLIDEAGVGNTATGYLLNDNTVIIAGNGTGKIYANENSRILCSICFIFCRIKQPEINS